jgi:hypothetical protein
MPRELARQSAWLDTKGTNLNILVHQVDRTVRLASTWVAKP